MNDFECLYIEGSNEVLPTYVVKHDEWLCAYVPAPKNLSKDIDGTCEFAYCTWHGTLEFLAEYAGLPEDTVFLGVDTGHLWNAEQHTTMSVKDALEQLCELVADACRGDLVLIGKYSRFIDAVKDKEYGFR